MGSVSHPVQLPTSGHICGLCQRTLPDLILKRRYMHDHQPSLRALKASAEAGCKSCDLLYHNFAYTGYKEAVSDDGSVVVGRSSKQEWLKVMLRSADNEVAYGSEIPFQVLGSSQHLADGSLTEVKNCLSGAANTPENIALVKELIQDCLENHHTCTAAGDSTVMPTRLLDVSPSNKLNVVKIVAGVDVVAHCRRYVCLSHCWGFVPDDAPWKLMTARKSAYMTEIDMAILPLTFQQAIYYTRDLGQKYLWIDSLCIIQDSAEDWAFEASRMASIYTNSLVTISSASASSSEGCISQRDTKIVEPVVLNVDSHGENGREAYLFHSVPDEKQLQLSVPVTKRAWCLQERRLTVRAIQFTPYQWIWTCRTGTTSERILRDLSIHAGSSAATGSARLTYYNARDSSATKTTRGDGAISDETEVIRWKTLRKDYDPFYKTLEDFSRCDITYPTDRLPAFAGLAQRQQLRTPGTYLAGLWENDLLYGLMWNSNASPSARPSAYIAPSWSWASLNSAVTFDGFLHYPHHLSPRLIDYSISHSSTDELGMVTSGYLHMAGYMTKVHTEPMSSFANTQFRRSFRSVVSSRGQGTLMLDTDADAEDCDNIMCLSVLDGRGIALRLLDRKAQQDRPAFTRVGSFKLSPEVFEGVVETEFDMF